MVPVILLRLDGVVDKLTDGARVLDVGCGAGVAVEAIAQAFPNSSVEGVDLSLHAIERARERLADLPNAAARHGRAEDVADAAAYDLVLTFDCRHDMTRPDAAMTAVRRAVREDGTWLVKEIRCRPTWEQNRRNRCSPCSPGSRSRRAWCRRHPNQEGPHSEPSVCTASCWSRWLVTPASAA